MNILGLDTSSKAASCALMSRDRLVGEFFLNAGLTHSETIMPMVRDMMERAGMDIGDVDVFAVSVGPGSFTGLRIGLSAVKGMAMAAGKPCAGISTLYGLALNVAMFRGIVIPVLDARNAQVYTALFRSGGDLPERLHGDGAMSLTELRELLLPYGSTPKMLVGDGAKLCRQAFADMPELECAPENLLYQRAGSICIAAREAALQKCTVSADELSPAYFRLPQAQRELEQKQRETKG